MKAHKWLIGRGRLQQANCLEAIVTHTERNATRAAADPQHRKSRRCGCSQETLRRLYWDYDANKDIKDDDVQKTQRLCKFACSEL